MSAELAQAALRDAAAQLRSAADVGTVRSVLLGAIAALTPGAGRTSTGSGDGCTPLCEALFSRFLDTLLGRVLPNWVPCMSTSQREACFDVWFVGTMIPLHFALLALGRALGADTHADVRIVELLRLLLWKADQSAGGPARGMVQVLELAQSSIRAATGAAAGEAVLGLVVSIPERVANALKMEAPRWSTPEHFHATVAEATWQLFVQADAVSIVPGPWIVPMLLSRQARLRQAGIVMRVWTPRLLASAGALSDNTQCDPNSSVGASMVTIVRGVLEALPGPAFEEALRSLLACLPPFDSTPAPSVARHLLHTMLCPGLQSNHAWRYLCSQKLPTDRAMPRTQQARHSIRYVMDCLMHADLQHDDGANSPRNTLVGEALGSIINVWVDPEFAQHSTLDYHRYVTHSMLYCLELMVRHSSPARVQQRLDCEGWTGELMHGVQRRFDSTVVNVRMFGMLIAERLSALINPDNPLCFDEVAAVKASIQNGPNSSTIDQEVLDDVDFFHDRSGAPSSTSETAEDHVADAQSTIELRGDVTTTSVDQDGSTVVVETHTDDPDAILALAYNDESSCDSNSESNEEDAADDDGETSVASLEAFAVPDGLPQGRASHRPPKHVREVIAWLRLPKDPKPTDYDRYEAALRNVESLLYKTSDDGVSAGALHDEAKELITLLIHLQDALVEDESDTAGCSFLQLRHKAIVSTVVHAPAVGCIHLASTVFGENSSIASRLDCLRALEDASIQLSFPSRRRQRSQQQRPAVNGDAELSSVTTARAETLHSNPTRPEPKTRRWGHTARIARGEKRQEPIARRNEFSEFAGPVLFTLVAGFEKKGSTADYLRSEPVFVAKLLHCLAVVFEAAGQAPGLPRMAERLGELCWHLRGHSEATVRRGVLVVFVQLLIASSLDSSTIHGGDAGEWLREVAIDDPDASCRELAKSCLRS